MKTKYTNAEVLGWKDLPIEKLNELNVDIADLTPKQRSLLPWWKNIKNLIRTGADFVVVFGGRSNGKTYDVCKLLLEEYRDYKKRFVYLRRHPAAISTNSCKELFKQELIDEVFGAGYYMKIHAHEFILCHIEEYENSKGDVKEKEIKENIGSAVAISESHHKKGTNYSNVATLFFDEFISMQGEALVPNEFQRYEQLISTIKRAFKLKVILCANTVSKYSEYFTKYGINPDKIEMGETKYFLHPNGKYKVVVEYTKTHPLIQKLVSDMTNSEMIASGVWEIPPTDEIPSEENEIAAEHLLFTSYIETTDMTIGIYLRRGTWFSYEKNNYTIIPIEHEREFFVIRRIENGIKSDYFHLTNQKSLSRNHYHNLDYMLSDIKETTGYDIKRELVLGRVYCDNMHTADAFNRMWETFKVVSVRKLL